MGKTEDNYISRFFVRGNVDMKLHKLITAQADANVTFYDSYAASVDWWGQAATLRPHLVAPFIPLSYIEATDQNSLNTVLNSSYIQDGKFSSVVHSRILPIRWLMPMRLVTVNM